MIADFFVARAFRGVHIKVNNLAVNVVTILEGRDERTDILERSATHKLRVLVLQEVVVHRGQLFRLLVDRGYASDLCNLISARLTHLLFLVLRELIVQREYMILEVVEADNL